MANPQHIWYVEITDTYGGEANYGWAQRFRIKAASPQGAITKVSKLTRWRFRQEYDTGDLVRYNALGAAVCAFVEPEYDPTAFPYLQII